MRISTRAGFRGTNNTVALVATALGTVACFSCAELRDLSDPDAETTTSTITEANTGGTWPGFFEPATNPVTKT